MSEEEYVVENILRAKVARKGRKKIWHYYVKWLNYGPEDNTWEPKESFNGSEHFIEAFWARTKDAADKNHPEKYNLEEEVFTVGPPGKGRIKGPKPTSTTHTSAAKSKPVPPAKPKSASSVQLRSSDRRLVTPPPPSTEASESELEVQSLIEGDQPTPRAHTRKRRQSKIDLDDDDEHKNGIGRAPSTKRARGSTNSNKKVDGSADYVYQPKDDTELEVANDSISATLAGPRSPSRTQEESVRPNEKKESLPLPRRKSKPSLRVREAAAAVSSLPRRHASTTKVKGKKTGGAGEDDGLGDEDAEGEEVDEDDYKSLSGVGGGVITASSSHPLETNPSGQQTQSSREVTQTSTTLNDSDPATLDASSTKPSKVASKLPAHRTRAANPRMKMMEGPSLSTTGISTKARISRKDAEIDSPSSSKKPSSGTKELASVRRGRKSTTNMAADSGENFSFGVFGAALDGDIMMGDIEKPVPDLGSHQSALAGHSAIPAESLLDFEESGVAESSSDTSRKKSAALTLATSTSTIVNRPDGFIGNGSASTSSISAGWRQSTIFGPLGFSRPLSLSTPTAEKANSPYIASNNTFTLALSPSSSLLIVFHDVYLPSNPLLKPINDIVASSSPGPPGKFYNDQHALQMTATFSTEGSGGRIALHSDPSVLVTEQQSEDWQRFTTRLQTSLFVQPVGAHILAFCSSGNASLCEALGISPNLRGLEGVILACEVMIKDEGAYCDAAGLAANERW